MPIGGAPARLGKGPSSDGRNERGARLLSDKLSHEHDSSQAAANGASRHGATARPSPLAIAPAAAAATDAIVQAVGELSGAAHTKRRDRQQQGRSNDKSATTPTSEEARGEGQTGVHLPTFQRDGVWRATRILSDHHGILSDDGVAFRKTLVRRRDRGGVRTPATPASPHHRPRRPARSALDQVPG